MSFTFMSHTFLTAASTWAGVVAGIFAIVTVTTTITVTARLLEGLMGIRDVRADGCRQ
jgi:hypothetical protein